MSDSCLFCGILAGTVPATIVYQDEDVVAFMDPFPKTRGHLLVIPRVHVPTLLDASLHTLSVLLPSVQRVGTALCKALQVEGFNIFQNNGAVAGQVIPHLHIHVVPRYAKDDLPELPTQSSTKEEREEIAQQITTVLRSTSQGV